MHGLTESLSGYPDMNLYKIFARPLLFCFDPEWTHDRAIQACEIAGASRTVRALLSASYGFTDPRLEVDICGVRFANPIGLAAGFDKSGRAAQALAATGFGHVEIGSVSADPSDGNPKPRLFRLPRDRAIVVHYGLPNEGAEAVARRFSESRLLVPLGINIVKTNRGLGAPPESDDDLIDDYVRSVRTLSGCGDYVNLNLSCPNTETGRNFFAERGTTRRLLDALADLDLRCPVFLKVSPCGGVPAIEALLEEVEGVEFVSGFVFNLPPGKPETLVTPRHLVDPKPGAISGQPVERLINEAIRELYRRMGQQRYRIIGVGGVFTAEDAYRKITLGASLVQLLTAMVYEGPGVVRTINQGLVRLLERDGFGNVREAVGARNREA